MDKRKRVIYKILCNENGKFYIGVSVDYERRWKEHKINPPNKMKKDIKKYGWNAFSFHLVLENIIGEEEAFNYEICIIEVLHPEYNTTKGGNNLPSYHGEDIWNSALTNKNIIEIRDRYSKGETLAMLAKEFNTYKGNISDIVLGKAWRKVDGIISKIKSLKGENNSQAKLSEKNIIDIRERYSRGEKQASLAKEFNTLQNNISRIVNGKRWLHIGGPIKGVDYQ